MHSRLIIIHSPFLMLTTTTATIIIITVAATAFAFGKIHSVPKIVLLIVFPQAVSTILEAALG